MIVIYPIRMGTIRPGDDIVQAILHALKRRKVRLRAGDIIALASKIVSLSEGRLIKLSEVKPSRRARILARRHLMDARLVESVIREAERVYGGVEKALLTRKLGIATANAGIDLKNVPKGYAALWPADPDRSAERVRREIYRIFKRRIGVVIADSCVAPLRMGTRGLAIGLSGIVPIRDYRGRRDIFSNRIAITRQNLADDIASAAHLVMGEAKESIPAVLIRGLRVAAARRVSPQAVRISPKDCLYMGPSPRR